jgi:hypothetical protein
VLGDSLLGESGQAEFDASAYRGQA